MTAPDAASAAAPLPNAPLPRLIDAAQPLKLPPHPRLLLNAADVAAIKERVARQDWAKAYLDGLKTRCASWAGKTIELPARGGQWLHWYSCPKHGARLRTEGPARHVCPIDGEVFSGYPYDDVVLSYRHDELAVAARDLALGYQLTGEANWAAKAREILLGYAQRYATYLLHDINGKPKVGGGRVLPQTLDESIWLINMAQAADMVWDTLSAPEIETLKTKLFFPAAVDVIQKHRMGIHNIQCWKNSAVGLTGLLFDDVNLVADAIDGPAGYQKQVAEGIDADGAWYEGAWGYHFYTMSALAPLAEAARRCGIDLHGEPYKRMFLAPLDLAMPDGKLPAFNDSGSATAMNNANYEIALARYNDPRLALPLIPSDRRNLQAFINGVTPLPAAPALPEPSRNFPASGYAILRAGQGKDATWLCLKYGPHGGGHGHPDKNNFVLYGTGRVIANDPGTANYGVPIQAGWYRTTLAHNTLTVDEASQQPATGACLDFQTGAAWNAALIDAGAAIKGVSFRRAAFLLGSEVAVFIDLVHAADGPHTLDLAYHPSGAWASDLPGNALTPPDKPGYSYLRDLHALEGAEGLALGVRAPKSQGAAPDSWVVWAGGTPTTFWTGTGVGGNTEDRVPIVIARRQTASTAFAWAVTTRPAAAAPQISTVALTGMDGAPVAAHEAAAVRLTWGGETYLMVANPSGRAIRAIKAGDWAGRDKLAVVHP